MRICTTSFLFIIATLCAAYANVASAAGSQTAVGTVTATVIQPIQVRAESELDFGVLLVSTNPGEVVISPTGLRNVLGRVVMAPGSFDAARFDIIGKPLAFYTVNTPTTLIFENEHNLFAGDVISQITGHTRRNLLVNNFTTYSQNLRGGNHHGKLDARGKDSLSVGGTLIVPADAAPGRYRGFVPISVAYQ